MNFARRVFRLSAVYGFLALVPLFFLENRIGRDMPPPVTHPEYFYGFLGVGLAWQAAFWVIAQDPARHRPLMIPAILEKVSFGGAAAVLLILHRIPVPVFVSGMFDLLLAVLFFLAWKRTSAAGPDGA